MKTGKKKKITPGIIEGILIDQQTQDNHRDEKKRKTNINQRFKMMI